ncbi:MAG: diguanylate cyclase [Holophagaceae bacterium]|nr:diguanylate cyclase [Holophagaceae bacterium]
MASFFRYLFFAAVMSACGLMALPTPISSNEMPPGRQTFRAYDADQGLSNLAVWHLAQDSRGFIWAGTEAGLFRYDGSRFEPFGVKDGLPSSDILAMYSDPDGTLWVGTRRGLARWNGQSFEAVASAQGLPMVPIEGLASGPGGFWAATNDGPYFQDPAGRFTKAPGWPKGEATALSGGKKSDIMWVANWDGRSRVLAHRGGSWRVFEAPPGLDKERIDSLAEDGAGRLWARTPHSLWVLGPGASRFREASAPVSVINDRGFLITGRHGDIWLPTQHGLAHLEGDAWSVLGAKEGLPTTWCRTALEDREGSLWVGSVGVYRLLGRGLWHIYTQVDGLPSSVIWRIFRDRERQLWVGTDNGLARSIATGWEVIPGTLGHVIRTIVQGPDGVLYMAGVPGNEVLRYDQKRRVLQRFELGHDAAAKRIFRLKIDQNGVLWASTDGAGLFRAPLTPGNLKFERVELPQGLPTEYISDVHQDAAGRIWAPGERGLAMLENGRWRRFTMKDGLKQDHAAYIASTKGGDLLISYNEPLGLTLARYEEGRLKVLKQFDASAGLVEDMVYLTGEDAKGGIWIGTGKGVDLIRPEGIEHFGVAEGLVGEDCDNMAFFPEENGDVWIGTSTGLARFDAKAYHGLSAPPPTELTSLRLGQQAFWPGQKEIEVPFGSNTLEARFACLSFPREQAVHQRVRLVGLESEWHPTDTREARYPALGPGHYRLEVCSRIGQGAWGPVAAFDFKVLPAWWQSWWFRMLMGLGAAGLVALVVRWRMFALQQQNRLLEAQVAARTKELKAANDAMEWANDALESANEALRNQSLTDPLTGLRNRRFLGECLPEDVALVNRAFRELEAPRKERMALNIDLLFIMVDLDHFKLVNDEHGHAAGDKVLQQMGEIMKEATRDTDTVVRWGGEEFLVVARNVCRRDSTILVERIRSQVAFHLFDIGDGKSLRLTCSSGFALYPFIPELPQALAWERVVDVADHCLYAAKRAGRDAWVGLFPGEVADADMVLETRSMSIPDLISNGTLQVRSSLPPDAPLDWDLGESSPFVPVPR